VRGVGFKVQGVIFQLIGQHHALGLKPQNLVPNNLKPFQILK